MKQHRPRKRFGQNFLHDANVIENIVHAVNPQFNDMVVEVGPGLGALTRPLLSRLKHLYVIEVDRDIVAALKREFPAERLTVYEADALAFDFASFAMPLKVVGNLPYNISTPLLFHLATFDEQVIDMHFMLQKEVVERMVARPSTSAYGRLSVMLQYRFEMERILLVRPQSFWPPPAVDSAVVRMIPACGRCGVVNSEQELERLVMRAFSHRRKTLRNNLKGMLHEAILTRLNIDPNARAENMTVEQYVEVANLLRSGE